MKNLTLEELIEQWKPLSAPEIIEKIAFYRVKFTEEQDAIRKETGKTPFRTDVSYCKVLKSLFIELNARLLNGEEITIHYNKYVRHKGKANSPNEVKVIPRSVQFTSDKDGNFYFDGNKVEVEHNWEWAIKALKTKILTSAQSPVDFYLMHLDQTDKYTTDRNIFEDDCVVICEKYKAK